MRVSFALFALVAAIIMSLSTAFMPPTPRMARQVRREASSKGGDDHGDVSCVCVFSLPRTSVVSMPSLTYLCLARLVFELTHRDQYLIHSRPSPPFTRLLINPPLFSILSHRPARWRS